MDFSSIIQTITVYALPVLFAITIHEAAHAFTAKQLGDNTAFALGRVTLNPTKHIDMIGTILMPVFLLFATQGAFLFGYAKPVPVRFDRLRSPKRDMVWVALAGPASNFVMALLWAALGMGLGIAGMVGDGFFQRMCLAGVQINLVLFALNLFPLPPLDGGRIMVGVLPSKASYWLAQIERYGFFIVIGLLFLGVLGAWWITPIMQYSVVFLRVLLAPLQVFLPAN